MSYPDVPFALPDIGDEEIAAAAEVLRNGWLTTGPKTKQFEQSFNEYLGGGLDALAVNSATSGLHLALEALGVGPGDEVIVPSLTFTATAEVARYLGADPVIVDVNPKTLTIDPEKIRAAITSRTKVLLPVHYAGLACNMDEILKIARELNLKVVEDAAHALPTTFNGKLVGQLASDISVFSFYANKTITTGEGGMVVTRHADLARRMRIMRLHGISRDAFDRFNSSSPSWYYEIVAPGYKYNLTDIASAIGIEQLLKLSRFHQRRCELASHYTESLRDLPVLTPADSPPGDIHAWHLYVIRLTDASPISRNEVINELARRGISTSVHYVPLHRQPYWRQRYNLDASMYPVSDDAYSSMISIPLYSKLSDIDQQRVIASLRQILS